MKKLFFFFLLISISFFSCNQQNEEIEKLHERISSLENKLENSYKPGFGELMSGIQDHHLKLWFAGKNENWKLAEFEIHEIHEIIDDVIKFQKDREETKSIDMIFQTLKTVSDAIEKQDTKLFEDNYILMTNTCNECHRITNFEYNIVKKPDFQSFGNQQFKMN